MELFVEIVEAAKVEQRGRLRVRTICPLAENFSTKRQFISQLALQKPASKKIIAMTRGWIDRITAAAIRRPLPPTLLRPKGYRPPDTSVSQASIRIT